MHYDGFAILLVVIIGLVPICRGGQWHWEVVGRNKALNALFWCGWFIGLLVGVLRLSGLG
jgi:hypothetical protein